MSTTFTSIVSGHYDDHTGEGNTCYSVAENSDRVQTLSVPSDVGTGVALSNCRIHCRTLGLRYTLKSTEDDLCHCTEQALKSRQTCTGTSEFMLYSNGLGFAPVSFTIPIETPDATKDFNTDIIDSQLIKVTMNSG